jgi:hypothetical protein
MRIHSIGLHNASYSPFSHVLSSFICD